MGDQAATTSYSDKRSHLLGCILVIAGVVIVVALGLAWLSGGAYTEAVPRPFNSERWKAADTWGDARCGMVADLTQRVGLVGRSRAEIVALLGEPEDEDADPTSSHWHLCPSFMDVYILEVRWRGDRVAATKVRDT
jgi:hypothetical protein